MAEISGLIVLVLAVVVVIWNPYRRDKEVDERLAALKQQTETKKWLGLPLDLTDLAARLASRMRF